MRSTTSTSSRNKGRAPSRPRDERPTTRINRAQIRAMEARAAALPAEPVVRTPETDPKPATASVGRGAAFLSRRRQVSRPVGLTREQELAFIKLDMRRLVITAGALFLLMIALLFILD